MIRKRDALLSVVFALVVVGFGGFVMWFFKNYNDLAVTIATILGGVWIWVIRTYK